MIRAAGGRTDPDGTRDRLVAEAFDLDSFVERLNSLRATADAAGHARKWAAHFAFECDSEFGTSPAFVAPGGATAGGGFEPWDSEFRLCPPEWTPTPVEPDDVYRDLSVGPGSRALWQQNMLTLVRLAVQQVAVPLRLAGLPVPLPQLSLSEFAQTLFDKADEVDTARRPGALDPGPEPTRTDGPPWHSVDFSRVVCHLGPLGPTPPQANALRALWDDWENEGPGLTHADIVAAAGASLAEARADHVFKSLTDAAGRRVWGRLVERVGSGKGVRFRLSFGPPAAARRQTA